MGVDLGIWFDLTLSRAGVDITEKVNVEPPYNVRAHRLLSPVSSNFPEEKG